MKQRHRNRTTPYCLVFMVIFSALGVLGLTAFSMDETGWLYRLIGLTGSDAQALAVAAGIGGCLSLCYCVLLLIIATDRRGSRTERRKVQADTGVEDRRGDDDRRGIQPDEFPADQRSATPRRTNPV